MIFTHVYHIKLTGGPMDGLDVQSLVDPGEILIYRAFHLSSRRWSWHSYALDTSFNFERYYRFEVEGPVMINYKPPKSLDNRC